MLPEDEVIDIKCKPQERAVAGSNAVTFQENLWVTYILHFPAKIQSIFPRKIQIFPAIQIKGTRQIKTVLPWI